MIYFSVPLVSTTLHHDIAACWIHNKDIVDTEEDLAEAEDDLDEAEAKYANASQRFIRKLDDAQDNICKPSGS